MRAALYTRISLDRTGESLGVQRQSDDCRKLADQLGWTVVHTFTDNDISATSGKRRPGFEALLAAMAADEVDAVICWHPDRLYRKLSDLSRLLDVAKGVELRSVTAGELDLSTPTGRMLAGILGSVSTAEVEHKAERQRRAARQLAESGKPKWRRAFGYLDTPTGPVLDPLAAPLVAEAYALVLAGGSLNDVAALWNSADALTVSGKRWTAPAVSQFLRRPRNAALRTYQADRGPADRDSIIGAGTWEPLVDPDTFWAVQAVLESPGRRPGRKSVSKHPLTGIISCGACGDGFLKGQWVSNPNGGQPGRLKAGQVRRGPTGRTYAIAYSCATCRRNGIRAHHLEPLLYDLVAGRLAMPDAVGLLKAELHDQAEAEALRVEANALRTQLDQLGVDYAEGLLTARQVKTATEVIESKLAAVEHRQHDAARTRVFDGIPLGTPEVAAAVEALSPDRFRAVLDVLMTVTVDPVGKSGKDFKTERVRVVWR